MPSIIPTKFKTELARSFHRDIVNTLNVPSGDLNTLVTLGTTNYIYSGTVGNTTFSGADTRGRTLEYTPGRLEVFVDGIKLSNDQYIANDGESIELLSAIGSKETDFEFIALSFSNTDVTSASDTITYVSHGFVTGDAVLYRENGGNAIAGIADNFRYFVIRIDDDTIKLAATYLNATTGAGTPIDINATSSTGTDYLLVPLNTVSFEVADITAVASEPGNHTIQIVDHDFGTGDAVVYHENSGDPIPTLTDGSVYYIIRGSENIIQLATTIDNALEGTAIDFDTTGLTGTNYTLVSLNDNNILIPRTLPTSAVNTGTNVFTILDHQFQDDDRVTYHSRGGTAITGLTNGSNYYIVNRTANTFQVSETEGGSAVTISGTGNNNQTFNFVNEKIDTITIEDHDFITGQAVEYTEGTGAIGGLTDGTTYYIIKVDNDNIQLATSEANANAGTEIILSMPITDGTFKLTGPLSETVVVNTFNITNFPNPRDYFHVFLSRPVEWSSEPTAPTPSDTRLDEATLKKNIMGVKKVNPSDVCLMARRVDWVSGTVYTEYADDVDLTDEDFYVFNSDNYRIYKCLNNNNGNASTVKPSFSDVGPRNLSDGYRWQLIYEVSAADRLKFLDDDYIPVRFYGTSTRFDHNGTITELILDSRGSGFTSAPTVLILGDGTGATATATVTNGYISSLDLTNGGSGYSFAFVYIYGGGGSNATATAVLEVTDLPNVVNQNVASYAVAINGSIDRIDVTANGSGYIPSTTTVQIKGDGTGAFARPVIAEGLITEIDVIDRGTSYTYAEVIIQGDGSNATAKATISPQGGHGANVPQELMATTVAISVNIEDFQEDFFLNNDFRQYGLIKNVKTFDNENLFSAATGNACYVITVPDGSEYNLDDVITSGAGGEYLVAYVDNNTVYLLPTINNSNVEFDTDTVLDNETTSTTGLTVTTVTDPEISHRWGEVIYYSNISPLTREEFQTEKIKLYINF